MIKLENINIVFGNKTVITGGELVIERGKVTALTGPSGCGKTTLLYCLGLISSQTGYQYSFDGKHLSLKNDKEKATYRKRKIGYVFQDNNLIDTMNVTDNLLTSFSFTGGELNGETVKEKLLHLLNLIGLSDKAKHYPRQLSGGERQRVAIACALIKNPDLIVADEPTSALDKKSSDLVFSLLQKIAHEQNRMVVIATHDSNIYGRANHIYSISDKKLFLNGTVAETIEENETNSVAIHGLNWQFMFRYIRSNVNKVAARKYAVLIMCALSVSFISLCVDFGQNFVSGQEVLMSRISNREIYVVNATSAPPGYVKKYATENRAFTKEQYNQVGKPLGVNEVIPYFELNGIGINGEEVQFLVVPYHKDQLMDAKSILLDKKVEGSQTAYLSYSLAKKLGVDSLNSVKLILDFLAPTKIESKIIDKIEKEMPVTRREQISVLVRGVLDGQLTNNYSESQEKNIIYLPHSFLSDLIEENRSTEFEKNEKEWLPSACWVMTYSYSDVLDVKRELKNMDTSFRVFSQYQDFEVMNDSIQQTRTIMMIVSVAIFFIICLLMTVIQVHETEKRKYEVCLLKANGMTQGEVYRLVLTESIYVAFKIFVLASLFTCSLVVLVNAVLFYQELIPLNLKLFLALFGISVLTIVPPSIITLIFFNRYEPDKLLRGF